MADESVTDLIRRVRTSLQERGPLGAFLLTELESAIASGIEDDSRPSTRDTGASLEAPGRRAPTEAELLEILAGVLETYLLTLPSIANAMTVRLRERFQITDCEIELDRSLLRAELETAGLTRLDAVIPKTDQKVYSAIQQIHQIARERM